MAAIIPTQVSQEQTKKKTLLVTIAVVCAIILLSFGVYFISKKLFKAESMQGAPSTINEVLVESKKNEFIKKIKDIEKNPPKNVNGDAIIKLLPKYYPSDPSQVVNSLSSIPFVKNELLVITKKNYSSPVFINEINAIGAKPVSYSYNNFKLIFPTKTSFEDFFAAKAALETSSEVELVTINIVESPS